MILLKRFTLEDLKLQVTCRPRAGVRTSAATRDLGLYGPLRRIDPYVPQRNSTSDVRITSSHHCCNRCAMLLAILSVGVFVHV
jgi:hypothetical protein